MTVSELVEQAAATIDRRDAEILLSHLLEKELGGKVNRSYIFTRSKSEVAEEIANSFIKLVDRRAGGEPLPYLTGTVAFFNLTLKVDHRVVIPRPETELLVDGAIEVVEDRLAGTKIRASGSQFSIADIGTGSGAIALALAKNLAPLGVPLDIVATDISEDALACAKENARLLGLARQIAFRHGDLTEPLSEKFDLICANLPYIPSTFTEMPGFEPRLGLDGGEDGLRVIERFLEEAPGCLALGGTVLIEIGHDQGGPVESLAQKAFPQSAIDLRQDTSGQDRLLIVRERGLTRSL